MTLPVPGVVGAVSVGVLLLAGCGPDPSPGHDAAARIDSLVQGVVVDGVVAGASVAVLRGDEPVLVRGFGLADREADVEATAATSFNLGSVSKIFTAAALVDLAEEGALELDDPVSRWLPELADGGPGDSLPLRRLLNHTSGLPEYGRFDLERWERTGQPLSPEIVYAWLAGRGLDYEPGTHWAYNNTGFFLAGEVVAAASGRSWADFVRERLLSGTGLEAIRLCDEATGERTRGYELRDRGLEPTPLYIEAGVRGDGGLCATAEALARFVRELESGGIVPQASVAAMLAPTELASGTLVDYGLGVRLGELGGRRLWGHTGGHAGYVAAVARYPEEDLTVAVLVNTIRSAQGALTLEGRIAAVLLGVDERAPATVEMDPVSLAGYAGAYRGGLGEAAEPVRRLTVEEGALVERVEGEGGSWRLLPVGADVFVREGDPYPLDRYVFHRTEGEVRAYSGYFNGFHQVFWARINE